MPSSTDAPPSPNSRATVGVTSRTASSSAGAAANSGSTASRPRQPISVSRASVSDTNARRRPSP